MLQVSGDDNIGMSQVLLEDLFTTRSVYLSTELSLLGTIRLQVSACICACVCVSMYEFIYLDVIHGVRYIFI